MFRLVMSAIALASAGPALAAQDTARTAEKLDQAIATFRPPAMSAVVIRNGKAEPEVARGVQQLGGQTPVKTGQLWNLGSITKMMTATMIARLVERGKLSWTARLDQMLPDLADAMRPEYRDVTLVDLLSHSAGLPAQLADEKWVVEKFLHNSDPVSRQRTEYLRRGLGDPPVAPRGTKASYSNTGYIIAAAIAERAMGKPYEQLMRELVFEPLGMSSATFDQERESDEFKSYFEGRPAEPDEGNPEIFNGAGEVRMTMADWAKFTVDQIAGESGTGKLLKADSYRMMHTSQGPKDSGWGFGWEIRPRGFGRQGPVLFHNGSDGNWIVMVAVFPKSGNGFLVATNGGYSMGVDKALTAAARSLAIGLAPPFAAVANGQE